MTTQQQAYYSPAGYYKLVPEEQAALQHWIVGVICSSDTLEERTSYALKHDFEHEGFYITNGQFKGAMLAAGYLPANPSELGRAGQLWRDRSASPAALIAKRARE